MTTSDDLASTPLGVALDGDLLIEASAGTGKTYALTTLVARAVVEAQIGIHQLLVVTFTVAATGELRQRIRRTLQEAAAGQQSGNGASSAQARELRQRWERRGIDRGDAAGRLRRAVQDLDRATILTIHGLCQRLLTDFAFDGAIPFGMDVSGDDTPAVAAAVRDFWRRRVAPAPARLLQHAPALAPALLEWVGRLHPKHLLIRGADDDLADLEASFELREGAWRAEFDAVGRAWPAHGEDFLAALGSLRWYKNSGAKLARVCKAAQRAFAANDPGRLPLADSGYLSRSKLSSILLRRPPQTLPDNPLLDHFERLGAAAAEVEPIAARWVRALRRDLLEDVREHLRAKAWEERRLSFNDLLTETARALEGPAGGVMAERIRERFPLALVDEFQDTDGLQVDILKRIYPPRAAASAPREAPAPTGLIIVGDPKQSIFRFRGADVFAYLAAKRRAKRTLPLRRNYRSTPTLVSAVNAVFKRPHPFLLPELPFEAALPKPASGSGEGLVLPPGYAPAPLQLRLAAAGDSLVMDEARDLAAAGAASEIAELLQLAEAGRVLRDGEPLAGGDIAVLVRTSAQGQATAAALRARGVQSVEMGDVGLFETPQAAQMHLLLLALADPTAYRGAARRRGALAADAFGLQLHDLERLSTDGRVWGDWETRLRQWREVWRSSGVAALIRRILFTAPTHCAERMLRLPDGPRQLTNMLHLAELLQRAETSERLPPAGLVEWLAHKRRGAGQGDEEAQLRLESDDRLVKVVTVHRAKGLEYPVVFCPFAWYRRRPRREDTAQYHEQSGSYREVLDLAPTDDAHEREYAEDQAEELRLLYVALTRAQHRCVVTWVRAKGHERSPLAWLLLGCDAVGDDPAAADQQNRRAVRKLSGDAWRRKLQALEAAHPGAIAVTDLAPAPPAAPPVPGAAPSPAKARSLDRRLRRVRQMTSYSALAGGSGAAASLAEHLEVARPDHDQREDVALADAEQDEAAHPEPAAPGAERLDAFTFPRGRRVGRCLHALFEDCSKPGVERPGTDLQSRARELLPKFGIEPRWAPVASAIVANVRATPLREPGESSFRLSDLRAAVVEMEFHLPVVGLDRPRLGGCLKAHGYPDPFAQAAATIDGYLRGFIDLVAEHQGRYYVVDYKSNWLGGDAAAYGQAPVRRAVYENGYHLQYLIYLVALHRHLRLRLPDYDYDRHLGGAFYLFVRAMTPQRPAAGVYFDRPSRACIEAIDACFGATA